MVWSRFWIVFRGFLMIFGQNQAVSLREIIVRI